MHNVAFYQDEKPVKFEGRKLYRTFENVFLFVRERERERERERAISLLMPQLGVNYRLKERRDIKGKFRGEPQYTFEL